MTDFRGQFTVTFCTRPGSLDEILQVWAADAAEAVWIARECRPDLAGLDATAAADW